MTRVPSMALRSPPAVAGGVGGEHAPVPVRRGPVRPRPTMIDTTGMTTRARASATATQVRRLVGRAGAVGRPEAAAAVARVVAPAHRPSIEASSYAPTDGQGRGRHPAHEHAGAHVGQHGDDEAAPDPARPTCQWQPAHVGRRPRRAGSRWWRRWWSWRRRGSGRWRRVIAPLTMATAIVSPRARPRPSTRRADHPGRGPRGR